MPCFRICKVDSDYNNMGEARKWWEEWDLRILVLYMFIAQLCLLFFGRLRRKNASPLMMIMSVWLIYLFADLLATIALGKLSKIKVDEKDTGEHALRVLWAPLILFYLGGPDTLTVLREEENKLWVRHLIGLLTQGVRAAYVLIVTWNMKGLSLLALLVFVPGIMKYGERVWVVRSRSAGNYKGFVHQLDLSIIETSYLRPNAKLVLQAYSWFQALMPHNSTYTCDPSKLSILVTKFHKSIREGTIDAFKLIEVELGLIYDMLFSKVGTIFTLWGSILRFLSFSLIVSVLVIFLKCDKPPGYLEGDHPITIILLAGAIFLEIAGVVVQLVSDWAMVWACKNVHPVVKTSSFNVQDTGSSPVRDSSSKWATSFLILHEYLISKRQRWSGVIGQFSLGDLRTKYKSKSTMCNNTWECVFGREKMLKRFSSQLSPLQHLKDLIIDHLRKKLEEVDSLQTPTQRPVNVGTSQTSIQKIASDDNLGTSTEKNADVSTSQTSTEKVADVDKLPILAVTRGRWTLSNNQLDQPQLKWSVDLKFDQSIVIWHLATQLCYDLDHPRIGGKDEVKVLSDYMMYLLVACHDAFPFCDKYDKITEYYVDKKEVRISSNSKGVEREGDANSITQVNEAQTLFQALERNPKRWEIMRGVWVEMLCYAAKKCPVKNHIQELRNGGEFLTHVWLLLMHFGVPKIMESDTSSQKDENDGWVKGGVNLTGENEANMAEKAEGGINATDEDLAKGGNVGGWDVSQL